MSDKRLLIDTAIIFTAVVGVAGSATYLYAARKSQKEDERQEVSYSQTDRR